MQQRNGEGRLWLRNPAAVWTGTGEQAGGGIVVSGKRIVELVAAGQSPRQAVDAEFDAGGLVLLPGLVNCHHHFYQTLTRAVPAAQNRELFAWLKSLYPIWAGLDEEAIALSTRLAQAELLLSGCTTGSDHHYLFSGAIERAIDIQAEVSRETGMRMVLTRGSMSLGERDGGLPPDSVVQREDEILRQSERLIAQYHDPSEDAMLQIALAPCSPFSVTPELMRASAALAREHGVLLHTHLAETEDENSFCLKLFGQRPLDYLESVGWLAADVWLAHGIHFSDSEIDRLGKAGTAISHCPSSNMILASGKCRVLELERAGSPVGLGVDGSASNDHSNMIEEVRQAFLLQRLHYGSAKVAAGDALRWATRGGARLLHRKNLGFIAPGALADLALFDLEALRFSGTHDPVAALVSSGAHQARHVMVNGQWRVRDGELPGIDLAALRREHQRAAEALLARAG